MMANNRASMQTATTAAPNTDSNLVGGNTTGTGIGHHGLGTSTGVGAKDGYAGNNAGYGGGAGYGNRGGHGSNYWNLDNDPNFVQEPGFPHYNRRIASPGPLGMFAQAISLLLWGFYIVRARGISETSFFVGMALSVGGIVQFLAGMWEFRTGNTFAATQFSMFGGFWFAVGLLYIPGTAGVTAYGPSNPDIFAAGGSYEFHQAIGFFFMVWWLFTFCLFLASFRSSATLVVKLFLTWMMFLLFFAGEFTSTYNIIRAGGGFAIAAGFVAIYQATASLMTHETSFVPLHRKGLFELPKYRYDAGANGAGGAGNRY